MISLHARTRKAFQKIGYFSERGPGGKSLPAAPGAQNRQFLKGFFAEGSEGGGGDAWAQQMKEEFPCHRYF